MWARSFTRIAVRCFSFKGREALPPLPPPLPLLLTLPAPMHHPPRIMRSLRAILTTKTTRSAINLVWGAGAWCRSYSTSVRDRRCWRWKRKTKLRFPGVPESSDTSLKVENPSIYQMLIRQDLEIPFYQTISTFPFYLSYIMRTRFVSHLFNHWEFSMNHTWFICIRNRYAYCFRQKVTCKQMCTNILYLYE